MTEAGRPARSAAPRPPRPSQVFSVGERQLISGVAELLHGKQLADPAQLLTAGLNDVDAPPRVVVVGEVKRGKSTLVNALAGGQVSPTGMDVVTFCPIQLEPPTAERPVGSGQLVSRDGTLGPVIPVGELLPMLDPSRAEPASESGGPARAVVSVDQALLNGVVLIDTPGVGGLNEAHVRATLTALAQATAVLFVSDGGQPLTRPELDFLAQAAQTVEFVLFALTKTDLTSSWEEILSENQRLLGRYAPRFAGAPWYPTAGELATLAWDPALSAQDARFLVEGSRIAELAEGLQDIATHAKTARAANALRHGVAGLATVDAGLAVELAALEDPDAVESIESEGDRLSVLVDRRDFGLQYDIPAELSELRAEIAAQLDLQRKEITTRLANRLTTMGRDPVAERRFEAELDAELRALEGLVGDRLTEGMTRVTNLAFTGLPEPELELPRVPVPAVLGAVTPEPAAPVLGQGSNRQAAGMFMEIAGVGITMAMGALFGNPILGLVSAPATLLRLFSHRQQSQQQQQLQTVRESLLTVQQDSLREVDKVLNDFRAQLYRALRAQLTRTIDELQRAIASAQRSGQERQRRIQAIAGERAKLAEHVGALESVRERILAAVAGTPGPVQLSND